jgi:hypothetical protein
MLIASFVKPHLLRQASTQRLGRRYQQTIAGKRKHRDAFSQGSQSIRGLSNKAGTVRRTGMVRTPLALFA